MLKNSLKYSSFQAPKTPLDSNVEEEGHDREASDANDNSTTGNDDDPNPNHANTTTTHDDPTEMHHWKRLSMAPLPLTHSHAFSTREKVVGLKDAGALSSSWRARRHEFLQTSHQMNLSTDTIAVPTTIMTTTEEKEEIARRKETKNPIVLLLLGNLAAFKVMIFYLISLETILTCSITSGLIVFWYNLAKEQAEKGQTWTGDSMDFIILAFAVISPISAAIGMAFTRREGALMTIADMTSFVHHLYLAHCLWDWPEHGGRAECDTLDLFAHCDAVLAQLVGIGDELSRFLTLPTTSRSRHRMTKHGRKEAARTIEVAYRLLESMVTHRMTRLSIYAERIKKAGLSSGEVSRIRQYERFIHNSIERLRMYKMYRTPQALRSFARIFTFLLPPFYAPKFAQVAIDLNSLEIGLFFGIITTIGLTALFESLQVLEDPFVGYLTLDGIDVREEFEVLMWSTLVKTRSMIFPDAPPYPMGRRAAMVVLSPEQKGNLSRKPSTIHIARNATSRVSMGASSSHVDTASRRDLHATSIGGGVADEDSNFVLMDSHHRPPPTTSSTSAGVAGIAGVDDEFSLLTIQTNSYDQDDDIEAAEFGHPILEDPVSEEFLRQTNYRQDGQLVQHRRSKSARSSSSLAGLVWRSNATASPQRSLQQPL